MKEVEGLSLPCGLAEDCRESLVLRLSAVGRPSFRRPVVSI